MGKIDSSALYRKLALNRRVSNGETVDMREARVPESTPTVGKTKLAEDFRGKLFGRSGRSKETGFAPVNETLIDHPRDGGDGDRAGDREYDAGFEQRDALGTGAGGMGGAFGFQCESCGNSLKSSKHGYDVSCKCGKTYGHRDVMERLKK